MIIAIAGASGLTGIACLQQLLQDERVSHVVSIGRRPLGIVHPKLTEIMLVGGKLETPVKADGFICCLGTTLRKAGSEAAFRAVDFELPLHLAEALSQEGCRKMAVISAMGANLKSLVFYNRVKGEMELALRKLPFDALHILRPSFIEGNRQESRPMEKLGLFLFRMIDPLLKGNMSHYRIIKAETLAAGLITAVMSSNHGQFVYLSEEIKNLVSH
jgi:uncharacterized protein YbjT (DUF2867 family)